MKRVFFSIVCLFYFLSSGLFAQQEKVVPGFRFFGKNSNAILKQSTKADSDSLPVIRDEFLINNLSGSFNADEWYPDIARDSSGSYAVTWIDLRMGYNQIYAQFFDKNDNPIGGNIKVSDEPTDWNNRPVIACNKSGDYVVAWSHSHNQIFVQLLNKDYGKYGRNLIVNSHSYANISEPSVAVASDGSFAAVYSTDKANTYMDDLYIVFFDKLGGRLRGDILVNSQRGNQVSSFGWGNQIAVDGFDNFIVTWPAFEENKSEIFAQLFDKNGNYKNNNFLVSDSTSGGNYTFPTVCGTDSNKFLVVYGNNGVYGRIINDEGDFLSDELEIFTLNNSWLPSDVNSYKDSLFTVAWSGSAFGYRVIDVHGNFITPVEDFLTRDSSYTYANYSTISRILDDGFYVSFHQYVDGVRKVEVQKYSLNFKPLGNFINVSDAKHSSWQTDPIVSTNKNGYSLVVWNDERNGRSDIYGRVFDDNYEPVGDDFIINYFPVASNIKDKGAIPLSDGSFAVAYLNSASWTDNKVYLQRISESGDKSGGMIYIGEASLNDSKMALNENNSEIVITAYGEYSGGIKWWKYNYESKSLTDKKTFPISSYKAIDVSINEQLKTFVVWASSDSSQNMRIFGKAFDEMGNVYIDTLNYFTPANSNGYIAYLTSSLDNEDNVTLLWSENNVLNFYRKSKRTGDDYYQRIYTSSVAPPQIVFAKNNKLFFTYNARETIYYKYLNENKFEEKGGTLLTLPFFFSTSLRYYAKNSSAIFDNRLLVAFESNLNEGTGYDIWGKAFEVDFADTSKEFYYENLRDDVLYPVYPNPVNSNANLSYWVYSHHYVDISIFDVLGRKVKELVNGVKESGIYYISFDVSNLSSGVYFIRMKAFHDKVIKFVVLK